MHYLNDALLLKHSKQQYSNHLYSAVYTQSKIMKPEAHSNKFGCGIHQVTSIDILEPEEVRHIKYS